MKLPINSSLLGSALALGFVLSVQLASAEPDSNRGLWVGQVTLNAVNEVSVPIDENNDPVAPQPTETTPTSDAAHLKLILHVNGAGQVSLIKDVALLSRKDSVLRSSSDLALVTDERLYGEFPTQAAKRIASAVFDFGDPQATAAVSAVVDAAVDAVYDSVAGLSAADLELAADRTSAETAAFNAAKDDDASNAIVGAPEIVPSADAAAAFFEFLTTDLKLSVVDTIADGSADVDALKVEATDLANGSFYDDLRGSAMIDAIVAAVAGATAGEEQAAARAAAASYADLSNNYQRFIAGESFGDMITAAAAAAASAGKDQTPGIVEAYGGALEASPTLVSSTDHQLENGHQILLVGAPVAAYNGVHTVAVIDENTFAIDLELVAIEAGLETLGTWIRFDVIDDAVKNDPAVNGLQAEAATVQVAAYSDTRAISAIEIVCDGLVLAGVQAALELPGASADARTNRIAAAAEAGGRKSLENEVPRYALPVGAPSTDYTEFVRSAAYQGSAETAARAAAEAAVKEKADNILATESSIKGKAEAAAIEALDSVFSAAARAAQTELPVTAGATGGGFGGVGDPNNGTSALEIEIVLPANHPTNPFRHRRHPDHTVGFEIRRLVSLSFDPAEGGATPRAGVGVDRLTGTYREEIFGLHKPLGPGLDRGLIVEGTFELYRVSLIDTLNAR